MCYNIFKETSCMKKRLLSVLLVIAMAVTVFGCGKSGAVGDSAAIREFDPNDDTVYFAEQYIPLSSSTNDAGLRNMAMSAFNIVNAQRTSAGLGALTWNGGLENAAHIRSQEIESLFSHTRPDGREWWTVDGNLCYGENLARGFDSAEGAVSGWNNSPTHRANMMDPGFRSCSIAIYSNGGEYYWAQEFGY